MLAFTFSLAASRYETRRQLVLDEANAVGTTYLRTGLLPEPQRAKIRNLLKEYVTFRVKGIQAGGKYAISRSEELQDRLWGEAAALGEQHPASIIVGLFIQSLNEVIDLHTKRVTAILRSRIPGSIWAALYFVAVLAMTAMGYQTGLTGKRSSFAVITLVLSFSAVMLLIADLDRPHEGLLRVSQQVLIDLQEKIGAPTH
jgi:hypothetical protein